MQPPLLVRAPREHCALLSAPAAHGPGATLGGLCPPKTPWQEPEVPAPPTSTQTHAAAPVRPRFARTLRASSVRCGARAMGYVRGFAPNTPPGNFTVLNRRASPYRAHRLFRTAPSGRCFGHWPRSPLALWTFHLFPPCLRYLFLLHPSIPYRSAAIASSNPSAGISSHSSPFARFIHCHARISFHVFSHSSCT